MTTKAEGRNLTTVHWFTTTSSTVFLVELALLGLVANYSQTQRKGL